MAGFMRDILTTLSYDPVPLPSSSSAPREELSRLDERLAGFVQDGVTSRAALRIRPDECTVWDGNPRNQPGLNAENCRTLIESIASEGGNRIPVLVRVNGGDADRPYQLLVGSRRRFAINWLNHNGRPELRLNALIVDLSDEEAFRLADIENRERADITELDRARSYQVAVDRFYAGVQSRMAQSLNLSNSQLSRLLALAQLPDEVVGAFGTRDDLRVRHSEVLTPLLRRPEIRAQIIVAAIAISGEQQARASRRERLITPATVLARLKDAAVPPADDMRGASAILVGGQRIGRLRSLKAGGLSVELVVAAEGDIEEIMAELRQALIDARDIGDSGSGPHPVDHIRTH